MKVGIFLHESDFFQPWIWRNYYDRILNSELEAVVVEWSDEGHQIWELVEDLAPHPQFEMGFSLLVAESTEDILTLLREIEIERENPVIYVMQSPDLDFGRLMRSLHVFQGKVIPLTTADPEVAKDFAPLIRLEEGLEEKLEFYAEYGARFDMKIFPVFHSIGGGNYSPMVIRALKKAKALNFEKVFFWSWPSANSNGYLDLVLRPSQIFEATDEEKKEAQFTHVVIVPQVGVREKASENTNFIGFLPEKTKLVITHVKRKKDSTYGELAEGGWVLVSRGSHTNIIELEKTQ